MALTSARRELAGIYISLTAMERAFPSIPEVSTRRDLGRLSNALNERIAFILADNVTADPRLQQAAHTAHRIVVASRFFAGWLGMEDCRFLWCEPRWMERMLENAIGDLARVHPKVRGWFAE